MKPRDLLLAAPILGVIIGVLAITGKMYHLEPDEGFLASSDHINTDSIRKAEDMHNAWTNYHTILRKEITEMKNELDAKDKVYARKLNRTQFGKWMQTRLKLDNHLDNILAELGRADYKMNYKGESRFPELKTGIDSSMNAFKTGWHKEMASIK